MAPRLTFTSALSVCALLFSLTLVHAHDDGMDMSMDGAMSLDGGHGMMSNLHFQPFGDTLWFLGWVPRSTGAMAGACVGLFLLGIFERWVAGVRGGVERVWRARAQTLMTQRNRRANKGDDEKQKPAGGMRDVLALRTVPPFIPSQDIARGALHAVQAALGYALMLAVMTYQAAFIISIIAGLGVGETLFGRYTMAGAGASVH
ncbi:hypothetical protein D9619_009488 [Psilocybe cf. subviscida]|uniref:Copper transport protein n=1 Tax=Psilocybe cf. subviscida TaxID=2480587 RepID=A0A8H5BUB6_9AGAR|nr:hypothetical protein D9619_009488 [Psilocybe cf. subviscida]